MHSRVQEEEILRSLEVLASHPDVDKERLRAFLASPMEIFTAEGFHRGAQDIPS